MRCFIRSDVYLSATRNYFHVSDLVYVVNKTTANIFMV